MFRKAILAAAMGLVVSQAAQAALVVVGSEGALTSKVSSYGVESLESPDLGALPTQQKGPLSLSFSGAAAGTTLSDDGLGFLTNLGLGGRTANDGKQYWEAGGSFEISFSTSFQAFGFHGSDIGDFIQECGEVPGATVTCNGDPAHNNAALRVDVYYANGLLAFSNWIAGSADNMSSLFWGFYDDTDGVAFSKIVFTNLTEKTIDLGDLGVFTEIADGQGFDRFVVGFIEPEGPVVPEPGALALAGLGLLALVARRKRALRG